MAFTDDKYTISFADAQNRANVVYLDPDGYTGSATAVTPAEDPLTYIFGNDGDDEYRALNPTALEIRVKVDATTLFDDISGDAALSWRVRWERGGSEVWRGYLLTDEIEQPFDLPSILTLRAVCGLKELDGIVWDTATSEDSFVDHAATILAKLGGHANDIQFQANWHAYNGGSAVTGNSYSRYTFDSAAFNDPLDSTKDSVCSVALENIAGRFGGKIFFADGDWWMVQRDLLAATYTPDVRAFSGGAISAGSAVSVYTLTDAQIYSGAVRSNAPAYYQVPIVYYHYPQETGFFLNGGFEDWTGSVPDNWTEFGGGGNLTRIATTRQTVFVRDRSDSPEYETTYACEVHAVDYAGTSYADDSATYATQGIYQESQFDVNSTSHKVVVSFDAGLTNQASSGAYLDFFYAIWLNTSGTDYYWDATSGAWVSGTLGSAAGKMRRKVTNSFNSYSIETGNLPASSGRVRVYLYNVVDKGSKVPTGTGIIYDNFKVGYNTGDRNERVKTAVTATNASQTSGLIRSEQTFFVGQGPSVLHTGAIKGGDVIATLSSGATWDGTNTSLPVGASLSRSLVANDKILVYNTSGAALMVTVNANVSAGASPIVLSAGDGNLSASILSGSTIVYGWMVENWKAGAYAGAEASSGRTLDYLHANEILDQRGAPTRRLRLTFRPSSGSYWPYMPLSYESKTHSCVSLRYSARFDEYSGEWLAVEASGVSITLEEEYGDDFVRPTDFIKPIDEGRFGPRSGGITLSGMGGPQVVFTAVGDNRARFPRASVHSTDPTNVLTNNYIDGTIELASGSSIRFPGTDSSTAGTYITDQILRVRAGANTVSEMTASGGTGTMRTVSSSGGFTFQTTGTGFVEKSGDGQLVFNKAGGPSGHSLGTTTSSVDLTLFANDAPASYYIKFDASAGDILVQPAAAGGGKVKLSGVYWPAADGSADEYLKTDGAGQLSWVGVVGVAALDDIPALEASAGASGAERFVSDTDRGGLFEWSASGTTNGGTVFTDGASGYWNRIYDGELNAKWFGTVGDGVTDDRAALAAMDAVTGVNRIPAGTYKISSDVTISSDTVFEQGAVLKPDSAITVTINGKVQGDAADMLDVSAGGDFAFGVGVEKIHHRWFAGAGHVSLAAAIASSGVSGKPVFITEETIDLGGNSLSPTVDLWLEGIGEQSVITNGHRINCYNNVNLESVKFYNFVDDGGSSQGRMIFVRSDDASGDDIDSVEIRNCYFVNDSNAIESAAILAYEENPPVTGSLDKCIVTGCHFENVQSGVWLQTPVTQGDVSHNTFLNLDATNGGLISNIESYAIRFGANYDSSSTGYLDTYDDYPDVRGVNIAHNYIKTVKGGTTNETHGILVTGSHFHIVDNYIEDILGSTQDREAIYVRGSSNVVTANVIVDGAGADKNSSDGAIVFKNSIVSKRNICTDNVIHFRTRGGRCGIMAWDCHGGIIANNTIYAESGCGVNIAIDARGGWDVRGNRITLLDDGSGIAIAADRNDRGIKTHFVKSSVTNNHIYAAGTNENGIRAGYCHDAIIKDNFVEVPAGYGIRVEGDGSSVVDTFTADSGTDTFTAAAHIFKDGTPVVVSNSGGALPTGLSAATVYYVINAATDTFQLSATYGGSAIVISDNGTGTHSIDLAAYTERATVSGNTVLSNNAGLYAKNSERLRVEGNRFFSTGGNHIVQVENSTGALCSVDIARNEFGPNPNQSSQTLTYSAINIQDTSCQKVGIVGNVFRGTYSNSGGHRAVSLGAGEVRILNNVFEGSVSGSGSNGPFYIQNGIAVSLAVFSGNVFKSSLATEILQFEAGGTITTFVFTDNSIPDASSVPYDLNSITPTTSVISYMDYNTTTGNLEFNFGGDIVVDQNADISGYAAIDRYLNVGNPSSPTSTNGHIVAKEDITAEGSLKYAGTVSRLGVQILANRQTGWTAPGGTAQRTCGPTYTAPSIGATYDQTQVQNIANALEDVSRQQKALIDDLTTHGIIGS